MNYLNDPEVLQNWNEWLTFAALFHRPSSGYSKLHMPKFLFSVVFVFSMICQVASAQSIERIQFSGVASDNNNFQPVAGASFGSYLSGNGGSLTVGSEYGKSTFVPVQVKTLERPTVDVSVYPNPSSEEVFIDWKSGDPSGQFLVLLDANGKEVRKESVKSSRMSLILKDVAAGMYTLQIIKGLEKLGSYKIIKSK